MTSLVTQRVRQLADTLAELKIKVRAALATELAGAVGNAIRDVLVVTLVDRLVSTSRSSYSSPRSGNWRDDGDDRDQWGEPKDPWADDDYDRDRTPRRYELDEREDEKSEPGVPAAVAVAVGVNVGRWWFLKKGSIFAAVGAGLLATTLGVVGGPVARAVLTVLTAATDVLAAETILARTDST
jgi:hypothetical protein